MAYNKSKYVEAAQKLLNQGKVVQAVAEYQQILKHEPRDQVTLMTVGELYIRQGETFQAIDYFERLAQIFVSDGFLTKAIAVYKRIAKLAPEEIRPLEKLADLYVQQGVMSEARPLFLQLAEIHLKNHRQPEAVNLLKKLLTAEPDNLRIQIRLADLYQAMGQSKDAMDTYVSAAQRALARGDQAECEKLADKALAIDSHNLAAVIVKARSFSARGNVTQAAELLETVPDLEKGGEQAELLLDLYLKNLNWEKASALALRIFDADEKNFGLTQKIADALLQSGQGEKAMAIIERMRIPMLDAGENEAIAKLLIELTVRLPGRIEPHEWLVDSYGRTSDSFRLPDALAQLGDALVADGQLDRAKEVFEQLVEREPESDSAKRKLNDLLRSMGQAAPEEESASSDDNLKTELQSPPAPKVRPDNEGAEAEASASAASAASDPTSSLDEETQKFIAQSLTDVDLFASYGLANKAIGLLEAILRRAPQHTPTLEKLLDFVVGAGDDRRTAEIAARLEKLYTERNDHLSAERFAELRRRFQRAAGLSDEDLAAALLARAASDSGDSLPGTEEFNDQEPGVFEVAPDEHAVPASQASAKNHQGVHEVDLSEEWSRLMKEVPDGSPAETLTAQNPSQPAEFEIHAEPPPAEETVVPESVAEPAHSESAFIPPPEIPAITEFQVSLEPLPTEGDQTSSTQETSPEPEVAKNESDAAGSVTEEQPVRAENVADNQSHSAPEVPEPQPLEPVGAAQGTEKSEFEVDQDYDLILEPATLVPAHAEKPPDAPVDVRQSEPELVGHNGTKPPAGSDLASDQFLADLASEIQHLGMGELTPSYSKADTEAPAKVVDNANRSDSGPLQEVFDNFRAELGEMGAEDEDLETHYNLGTAFREMGLLEEAISEFQKVAKANERGRPFRYAMQCCTLLGLAFMEKGQPGIAAIWYERALQTPGVEPESILALRYDLGIAQESAGEPDAALKSFSKVYAMNIDYRDVAERIAALQKTSR
jgi:tetratricopeptide (TPR) repeat protein